MRQHGADGGCAEGAVVQRGALDSSSRDSSSTAPAARRYCSSGRVSTSLILAMPMIRRAASQPAKPKASIRIDSSQCSRKTSGYFSRPVAVCPPLAHRCSNACQDDAAPANSEFPGRQRRAQWARTPAASRFAQSRPRSESDRAVEGELRVEGLHRQPVAVAADEHAAGMQVPVDQCLRDRDEAEFHRHRRAHPRGVGLELLDLLLHGRQPDGVAFGPDERLGEHDILGQHAQFGIHGGRRRPPEGLLRPDAPDVPLGVVTQIFVGMLDKGLDVAYRNDPGGDKNVVAEMCRASIEYLEHYLV